MSAAPLRSAARDLGERSPSAAPRIVFRVDASLRMGIGHVMRCLTLADVLQAGGASCRFICRAHAGHLIELIRQRGHDAVALPLPAAATPAVDQPGECDYAAWLGTSWQRDAEETRAALDGERADWLIVDHYALDARWERVLRPAVARLMIIDDLANRSHAGDLLLDQNLGRRAEDYAGLVAAECRLLIGPRYALLRPEFAALREASLQRRDGAAPKRLLITMGGVDQPNATGQVLAALGHAPLAADCRITVVMGPTAPWLGAVRELAATLRWPTTVLTGVDNMAALMADSDLAIGAAGSTSWERCCLGLPTLMVVIADNQREVAACLESLQAARLLELGEPLPSMLHQQLETIQNDGTALAAMIRQAAGVTDGRGARRVSALLSDREAFER